MRRIHAKALAALVATLAANLAAQQFEAPFRIEAGGKPIDVEVGHAAPFVVDVDGDGVRDLLVGQFGQGRCRVYKNIGSNDKPEFGEFTWFEAGGKPAQVGAG